MAMPQLSDGVRPPEDPSTKPYIHQRHAKELMI